MTVDESKKDVNDRWKGMWMGKKKWNFYMWKKVTAKEYDVLRLQTDSLLQS